LTNHQCTEERARTEQKDKSKADTTKEIKCVKEGQNKCIHNTYRTKHYTSLLSNIYLSAKLNVNKKFMQA
jgi:hypothetical protein